ncbi:MAG: PQQ-binding-like beta-propeller repeat protein [Prolixibacteraceae bacterium]
MKNKHLFTLFICLLLAVINAESQSVSQWRGTNRDGNYSEQNLLKIWPEVGPELLWLNETIGDGYGSPVISGDKLFINGEINKVSYLFAFGLDGKLIWKSANGSEFAGSEYSANFPGARSTPTVDHDLVYVASGMGRIACFDAASGAEKWTVDMVADLGGKPGYFGYSESLLTDEKLLYCFPGGTETNLAALDKLSGKVVWTSKALGDGVSYCSPLMINLPERNILVNISHDYLMGLDARNGELLWSFKEDSVKLEGTYCNTPVYQDGFIYGVSGVDQGTGAYKLQLSDDGKSISEIWRNADTKNAFGGFVVVNNKLYCAAKDNKLKALDLNTGLESESVGGMKGSVIAAENKLICYADNGKVNLIDLSGPKMEVVSKFKIENGTKEHFSHPVIADGVLYVRHGNALMAYKIR